MRGKVLKYTLPREALSQPVNVPMPPAAQVLSVGHEGLRPVIYSVGEGEATEPRWFQIVWTHQFWPNGAQFLGTVKVDVAGGPAVWHIIELPELRGQH